MRTLRLLVWLRWRLAMNATSSRQRWGAIAIGALMALAFAPIYVGAALGAFVLGERHGAGALLLVFGGVQLTIVWVSLLAGALGILNRQKFGRY